MKSCKAQVLMTNSHINDLLSYKKEMKDINIDKWNTTMNFEMESMYSNSIWELIDKHNAVIPIRCKCFYKRTRGMDRKVKTFKTRLMAYGLFKIRSKTMRKPSSQ